MTQRTRTGAARPRRGAAVVATAIALAAMLCAPAAAASAGLAERVKAAVRPLGRGASVQVTDLATRRTVVAVRARRSRPLGSTAKLLTAAAALRRLGPDTALGTSALATAPIDANGVLVGDLILRGGGDPVLDDEQLAALGAGLGGLREITGSVVGDESLFDTVRTGPSANGAFDAELGGPLSALAYERGAQAPGGPPQADPARAAAARFDDVLEARGVVIRGVPRAGPTPPGALPLAAGASPTVCTLVKDMLTVSDDWIAEMLTKGLAAKVAPPGRPRPARRSSAPRRRSSARRSRSSTAPASMRATAAARPGSGPRCGDCACRRRSAPRSPARAGRARCATG